MNFNRDLIISVAVEWCRWRKKPNAKLLAKIVGVVLHAPKNNGQPVFAITVAHRKG
jgi:hypothetical protein